MTELNVLELAVLKKLFDGNQSALIALGRQVDVARVVSRQVTGAGFFTTFTVPSDVASAHVRDVKIRFGDVEAKIAGLRYGAGFLVYIESGRLQMLEGYSYDEPWPERVDSFELRYTNQRRPSLGQFFHNDAQ